MAWQRPSEVCKERVLALYHSGIVPCGAFFFVALNPGLTEEKG